MSAAFPLQIRDNENEAGRRANVPRPLTHSLDCTEEGLAMEPTHTHSERWLPIAASSGWYEVSSHGRVRRLAARLEAVTSGENMRRGEAPSAVAARTGRCLNGHLRTPENTYIRPDKGTPMCRDCARESVARRKATS